MTEGDGQSVRDRGESQSETWHDEHPCARYGPLVVGACRYRSLGFEPSRPGALTVVSCIQVIIWGEISQPQLSNNLWRGLSENSLSRKPSSCSIQTTFYMIV